jgi:hypothetical protein
MAFLFLFGPKIALNFIFPCLSAMLQAFRGELTSLVLGILANGTHLLALATAGWIATIYCRSNPTLRQAVTVAFTFHAGLLCLLPLGRIILEVGGNCAISSILIAFVPLFIGWVLYAAFLYRLNKTAGT